MAQKVLWVRKGTEGTGGFGEGGFPAVHQPSDVRFRRVAAEIDTRIDRLPPFPTVLTELIALTQRDDSDADELRSCVEKDPVIAARLLKLANSAFYSPRSSVTSIQQSVVMLGRQTVRSLAMAAATLKFLSGGFEAYGMGGGGLWLHSYGTAELARRFARLAGGEEDLQESVYVGGLLHDIGKIVLSGILTDAVAHGDSSLRGRRDENVRDWEKRVAGVTHAAVGEMIAEKWKLAPATVRCVRCHHSCDGGEEHYEKEVQLVTLADAGARRLGMGLGEADENPDREERAMGVLGISGSGFAEVLNEYEERSADAGDLFSLLG